MTPDELVTIGLLFLLALGSIAILWARQLIMAALLLLVILLDLGVLFILAGAEYLGVTQILLYAGGILILMLFGFLLTSGKDGFSKSLEVPYRIPGLLAGGGVLFILVLAILQRGDSGGQDQSDLETLGHELLGTHLVAFELAGILLLVTLAGAAVLAANLQSPPHE